MRRPSPFPVPRFRAGFLAVALVAAPFFVARGQSAAESTAGASSGTSARKPEAKVLRLEDFAQWNRITSPALSPDGKWMTFTYSPNEGGQTVLHVKALDGDKDYTASRRQRPLAVDAPAVRGGRGGGRRRKRAVVSRRFALGSVLRDARRARRRRPGRRRTRARRAAGGAARRATAAVGHLELLNLATGEKSSIPNAARGSSRPTRVGSRCKLNRPPAAAASGRSGCGRARPSNGADLIVRDLATGVVRNIGNVNLYDFDDAGSCSPTPWTPPSDSATASTCSIWRPARRGC